MVLTRSGSPDGGTNEWGNAGRARAGLTVVLFVVCTVLGTWGPGAAEQGVPEGPSVPTLHVTGEAIVERPADQLRLSISVVTEGEDAGIAMGENSRRMKAVIDSFERRGLDTTEYETGRFAIQPRYSQRPREADREWTPRIVGYRVENMVHLRTKKLELVGDLINDAVTAGANSIASIGFGLADPRIHRADAIREATANARADAAALATAAGVRLAGIRSIRLDDSPIAPVRLHTARMAMEKMDAAPPIQPGDVTVRARVTVVYAIEDR